MPITDGQVIDVRCGKKKCKVIIPKPPRDDDDSDSWSDSDSDSDSTE